MRVLIFIGNEVVNIRNKTIQLSTLVYYFPLLFLINFYIKYLAYCFEKT